MIVGDGPFDYEAEKRRDSERFADASVYDLLPDPSEYEARPEEDRPSIDEITADYQAAAYRYALEARKPGMIDENAILKGLLAMLFAVLASLMLWILIGAAVMRWILR